MLQNIVTYNQNLIKKMSVKEYQIVISKVVMSTFHNCQLDDVKIGNEHSYKDTKAFVADSSTISLMQNVY